MMEPHAAWNLWLAKGWILLASAAGALVGLSFLEKLTPLGRVVAWTTGFLAAVFVGPGLTELIFGPKASSHVLVMISFAVATSAMTAIPAALQQITKVIGDPLSLLHIGKPHD